MAVGANAIAVSDNFIGFGANVKLKENVAQGLPSCNWYSKILCKIPLVC